MPAILCFGDSNTWGYDPAASALSPFPQRHSAPQRWTGVLAAELGAGWEVIPAGQNGRTTVFEDPHHPGRCGRVALPIFLETSQPLDLVIIMLGTNDLKTVFRAPPGEIAAGAAALVRLVRQSAAGPRGAPPQVLLVCPPTVASLEHLPALAEKFEDAAARSRRLPEHFRTVARQLDCAFLDAQPLVVPSPHDGLHFDPASHRRLGEAMAQAVRSLPLAANPP